MSTFKLPEVLQLTTVTYCREEKDNLNIFTARPGLAFNMARVRDNTFIGRYWFPPIQAVVQLQPELENHLHGVVADNLKEPMVNLPVSRQNLPDSIFFFELENYLLTLMPLETSVPALPTEVTCRKSYPEERSNTDPSWLTEYFNVALLPKEAKLGPAEDAYSLLNALSLVYLYPSSQPH